MVRGAIERSAARIANHSGPCGELVEARCLQSSQIRAMYSFGVLKLHAGTESSRCIKIAGITQKRDALHLGIAQSVIDLTGYERSVCL